MSIKSGPRQGNASQIKKMQDRFRQARKIPSAKQPFIAVNGGCHGRDGRSEKGDYLKLCGRNLRELISGGEGMYTEIIDPLGHQAKKRNERFSQEYDRLLNRFQKDFLNDFDTEADVIKWPEIIAFDAAHDKAKI